MASVERFPQDFEQVLNFVAGGSWSFITGEFSPFVGIEKNKSTGVWAFLLQAEYRGMSESGRHYTITVKLKNDPDDPINGNGFERIKKWKQEFILYDPKGSSSVYFELQEIKELGPDTDGREREQYSSSDEESTPEQEKITNLLNKLKKIQDDIYKDHPKKKWTPERMVYFNISNPVKHARPVDLAKQIKNEIAKHEKLSPSFN